MKTAFSAQFLLLILLQAAAIRLYAQEIAKPASPSPLDTLLHAKLWPDIPEAEGFVKRTRPPAGSLQYEPLTKEGQDPVRPKPKSAKELDAMAAELEQARDANAAKAGLKSFKLKSPAHPGHKAAEPKS